MVYNWQFNRNPFIDQPDLIEYIWGNNVGDVWTQSLSIEDELQLKVSLYPNPTDNRIYISGLHSEASVEVFSIEGKLLKSFSAVNDYIDLELVSGIYMLKLKTENSSVVKKIVVR